MDRTALLATVSSRLAEVVILLTAAGEERLAAYAEDLAQQVLTAVSKAIDRWQIDPARAKFRTWLHRIAHNLSVLGAETNTADCRHVAGAPSTFSTSSYCHSGTAAVERSSAGSASRSIPGGASRS